MPNSLSTRKSGRKVTRRRQLEIERTRQEILLAAARALARSGFKAASMQEIADEVGFTAPALYSYFASKEAIFHELARTIERELIATFSPPPDPALPFRERIAALLRRQFAWVEERRDAFLAFFALQMRGEQIALEGGVEVGPEGYMKLLAEWLRAASDDPADLGGADFGEAAAVLMGLAHGFSTRWLAHGGESSLADKTDRILDIFFHGILGPLG